MTPLGSRWRDVPLIVRALLLPSPPALETCDTCGHAWHHTEAGDCPRCARRHQSDHDWILQPPAERRYGYATADDLHALRYNPAGDRHADLERWRHDLELAVDSGLITQHEGETAWQSVNKTPSTSLTGTTSTTTPTPTTKPSSTGSPSGAAGRPSHPRRKPANRRSSSPWQFRPPSKDTK